MTFIIFDKSHLSKVLFILGVNDKKQSSPLSWDKGFVCRDDEIHAIKFPCYDLGAVHVVSFARSSSLFQT